MELGFSPTINNTFTGYSHVSTFANLPSASSYTNQYFIVDNPSGVWLINRKEAGFYKSDGTSWNFVGTSVDMTSLSDGTTSVTASPIILQGTNGITATSDAVNNKIVISGASLPQLSSGTTAPSSTPSKIGNDYINTNGIFYKSKGSSSSSDWVKLNGSYTLQTGNSSSSSTGLNNATTYYSGAIWGSNGLSNAPTGAKIYIPRAGTISKIYGVFNQSAGSAETSNLYLRVNDTTDYLIANNVNLSTGQFTFNASFNVSVTAGDFIVLKWITPTWVTKPTYISINSVILVDL